MMKAFIDLIGSSYRDDEVMKKIKSVECPFQPIIIEKIQTNKFTDVQREVIGSRYVPSSCDLVDHVHELHDEDCKWILRTLESVDKLSSYEARDTNTLMKIPGVIEARVLSNCAWEHNCY